MKAPTTTDRSRTAGVRRGGRKALFPHQTAPLYYLWGRTQRSPCAVGISIERAATPFSGWSSRRPRHPAKFCPVYLGGETQRHGADRAAFFIPLPARFQAGTGAGFTMRTSFGATVRSALSWAREQNAARRRFRQSPARGGGARGFGSQIRFVVFEFAIERLADDAGGSPPPRSCSPPPTRERPADIFVLELVEGASASTASSVVSSPGLRFPQLWLADRWTLDPIAGVA